MARLSYGNRSLAALGLFLVAAQGFHPKVLILGREGQTASWLLALAAGGVGALALWPIAAALRQIPHGSLIDLVEAVLGRWGAILTALVTLGLISFGGAMTLRETSEMALSSVFPHTPQTFATTALLLGSVYVAWGDGSSIVRQGRLLLPMLLVALAIVLAGSVGWGELRYLLPFWGPGIPRLAAAIPAAAAIQFPVIILATLANGVDDRAGLVRWLPTVPLMGGVVLSATNLILAMVFAYPIGMNIPFPLHTAARLVLGGRFFERLEGLWVFVWVSATIVLLGSLLYTCALMFTRAFRMQRHQTAILPVATAMLAAAFFPTDQAEAIDAHLMVTPVFFYLVFIYPMLLSLVLLWRRRKGGKTG